MPRRTTARRANVFIIGYALVLVLACIWVSLGGPLSVLIVLASAPAIAALHRWVPLAAALPVVLIGLAWMTFLVFVVSRYTTLPPLPLVLALALLVGLGCAWTLHRRPPALRGEEVVDLGFAAIGGLVWCAVLALARLVPGGTPVSWAMMGDSANNVLFARTLLEHGGISLGVGQNPVPLTSALIGLFALPGGQGAHASVGHQIAALAEMWSFGIVAACLMAGVLALSLFPSRSPLRRIGAAVTSLAPLCWIMLSGPTNLGFVNFHVTLALLMASLVILIHSARSPLIALTSIALSLAGVLTLWAPLAGIPGVALMIVVVAHRRSLVRLRRGALVLALAALAQPVIVFVALSVPSVIGQGGLLQEALGAIFEFKKWMVLAVALLALVLGLVLARRIASPAVLWVLIAVYGGGGSCFAALLWLRRHESSLWGYYQLKFLWFLFAIAIVLVVAAGFALATAVRRRVLSSALVVLVLVVTSGLDQLAPLTVPAYRDDIQAVRSPIARILTGDFFFSGEDDRVYHEVARLTASDDRAILWGSSDPDEGSIMFWVVQMASSGVEDVTLRRYAYYHDVQSAEDACMVRRLMGGSVTLITAQPDVARDVSAFCPQAGPVRLER